MLERRRRHKIHEEAVRYAANGWPVAPLAAPRHGACPCGGSCLAPHLVGEVVRDGYRAAEVWPEPGRTARLKPGMRRLDEAELAPGALRHWTAEWGADGGGVGEEVGVAGGGAWEIALVAEWVDVMELPAEFGAGLNHRVKAGCPTAMAPATRRWMFFVVRGSVPREQIEGVGGVLRSGVREWVAAPGTWTEDTGRIRWLVHPYLTEWRPYQRRDPIDLTFL